MKRLCCTGHVRRSTTLFVGFALLASLLCDLLGGSGPIQAAEPDTLRVITYNIQLLPGIAAVANKRKDPGYRAATIGKEMASFDIVGLNEAFDEKPRTILIDELKKAWGDSLNIVVSPVPPDKRLMGGLVIASRLPFLATHTMIYSQGSSIEKYGIFADGFAAKGALHARIVRSSDAPNDFVDVFVTHLESKDDDIRSVQYRELADFIRQNSSPDHPMILMGDMNTRGNPERQANPQSPYHEMLSAYQAGRGDARLVDLWPFLEKGLGGTNQQESSDRGNRIDYIFFSNPLSDAERFVPLSVKVNGYLDPKVVALSDHSAVEALFRWRRP